MRSLLLLLCAGAATSFVREPRRLVRDMTKFGTDAERVAALLARGNDSGYTLPGEDTPLTPERFAAEILNLPGCRAGQVSQHLEGSVLVPGNEKRLPGLPAREKLAALSPDDALRQLSPQCVG